MATEIKAQQIGPIDAISIPIAPEGGVTVLKGYNGAGKDTAIEAVGRLLGGNENVECSDAARKGIVEGLGVRITVAKQARRSGQCEAVSLTGKFNLADFIEPPIKDPDAADRARIKALLAIRGVEADLSQFENLIGDRERLEKVIGPKAVDATDLVEQARLVKTGLETEARRLASQAQHERGHATACREAADAVDTSGEDDAEKLQTALEEAITKRGALIKQAANIEAELLLYNDAQRQLESTQTNYTGPTVDDATKTLEQAKAALHKASITVGQLRAQVTQAERAADLSEADLDRAEDHLASAQEHQNAINGWQATIDAGRPEPIDEDEATKATADVQAAREAIETGARIRDAKENAEKAEMHRLGAKQLSEEAETLREAAKGTDVVLSDAVDSESLWVESGCLVTQHARRGKCRFGELSKGEKWAFALLEAAKRIRELRADGIALIPIPQHAWEGLDPANRTLVAEQARRLKVNILTADCTTGGELRAELYRTGESNA